MSVKKVFKKLEVWGLLLATGAILVIIGVSLFVIFRPSPPTGVAELGAVEPEIIHRHPLTGLIIEQPLLALPQVFGVMVENSLDAWPLSGIEEAFLVIEAPVEGGIPRFLAFYGSDQQVAKIGPVRSARPYYLDWNEEFQALYAHVGGSPEALEKIAAVEVLDLNEFYQGEYFWRGAPPRYAPHNVYTSTENLTEALGEFSQLTPTYESWLFAEGAPSGLDRSLAIAFGGAYDVVWRYDEVTNRYGREQAGGEYPVEGGGGVVADNVVVMATRVAVIDNLGRREIRTTGEGEALLVQNGQAILAKWQKADRTSRLRFFHLETGDELIFKAGITWIEVVDELAKAQTFSSESLEELGDF